MNTKKTTKQNPLMCWDVMMMGFKGTPHSRELACLQEFGKKYSWQIDLTTIINDSFDAIVLTNHEQKIKWVSKGFFKMTGYPAQYAKGKRPTFLQGKDTSLTTRAYIREQLMLGNQLTTSVINYKKDGSSYACIIQIHPLRDANQKITHFLALEKEVHS